MQPVGFIAGENLLLGTKRGSEACQRLGAVAARQVVRVGLFEQSANVLAFSVGIVILDREQAMPQRMPCLPWIGIDVTAMTAQRNDCAWQVR